MVADYNPRRDRASILSTDNPALVFEAPVVSDNMREAGAELIRKRFDFLSLSPIELGFAAHEIFVAMLDAQKGNPLEINHFSAVAQNRSIDWATRGHKQLARSIAAEIRSVFGSS